MKNKLFNSPYKRYLTLVIIFVASFLLTGCVKRPTPQDSSKNNQKEIQEPQANKSKKENKSSTLSNVLGSKRYKCQVEATQGNTTLITDGKNMRVETTTEFGEKTYFVKKDNTSYFWREGDPKGIMFNKACIDELGEKFKPMQTTPESVEFDSPEELVKKIEEKSEQENLKCDLTKEKVNTNVPSNVNFIDQCELLKGLKNLIPQQGN